MKRKINTSGVFKNGRRRRELGEQEAKELTELLYAPVTDEEMEDIKKQKAGDPWDA